ncbi:MAG: HAD-IA family hydrolase [Candidatus Latescibacteria bacterium]|nr:HAD-IA family hydrolase [Candidatus Latescibacterota bacterium]NIM22526.1 HAD-IA family hydrolase [Candidatus Latescibacterota bacterium]NIM64840.1 HAD-IA family hydrolase [Candidatus Latescibacterota bacterium]NIO01348.1 HAD-IA family hydrolase [Candidatus Latescibacterota bacterium]NIO27837.1 HAD-IA family hydrolase [Candidatus Latescibacterota bacterium]
MDKLPVLEKLLCPAKGIIFDFDGLLARSEKYHYLSYRQVFARYGHALDEKEYYKYWTSLGLGAKGEIKRHWLDLDPEKIKEEKKTIFSRYCEDGSITFYDEARDMVRLFVGGSKQLAIASGSSTSDIRAVLRRAGMDGVFQAIVGNDVAPKLKPAPDPFLTAAELIGVSPPECLVLEDAEKGMFAAIEAKIPVVIILSQETKGFDFSLADLVFDSLGEFVSCLKKMKIE